MNQVLSRSRIWSFSGRPTGAKKEVAQITAVCFHFIIRDVRDEEVVEVEADYDASTLRRRKPLHVRIGLLFGLPEIVLHLLG